MFYITLNTTDVNVCIFSDKKILQDIKLIDYAKLFILFITWNTEWQTCLKDLVKDLYLCVLSNNVIEQAI